MLSGYIAFVVRPRINLDGNITNFRTVFFSILALKEGILLMLYNSVLCDFLPLVFQGYYSEQVSTWDVIPQQTNEYEPTPGRLVSLCHIRTKKTDTIKERGSNGDSNVGSLCVLLCDILHLENGRKEKGRTANFHP